MRWKWPTWCNQTHLRTLCSFILNIYQKVQLVRGRECKKHLHEVHDGNLGVDARWWLHIRCNLPLHCHCSCICCGCDLLEPCVCTKGAPRHSGTVPEDGIICSHGASTGVQIQDTSNANANSTCTGLEVIMFEFAVTGTGEDTVDRLRCQRSMPP